MDGSKHKLCTVIGGCEGGEFFKSAFNSRGSLRVSDPEYRFGDLDGQVYLMISKLGGGTGPSCGHKYLSLEMIFFPLNTNGFIQRIHGNGIFLFVRFTGDVFASGSL